MVKCSSKLQASPLVYSPAVQSAIWLKGLKSLRTQVEGNVGRCSRDGEDAPSQKHFSRLSDPLVFLPPLFPLLSPLLPSRTHWSDGGNRAELSPPGHYETHTCCHFGLIFSHLSPGLVPYFPPIGLTSLSFFLFFITWINFFCVSHILFRKVPFLFRTLR